MDIVDTDAGYITECPHYPLGKQGNRKLDIMVCDLDLTSAGCKGDIGGCDSSRCRNPKFRKMTRDQYLEHKGLRDEAERFSSVSDRTPGRDGSQ
jgi:hypothetical protein